MTALGGKRAEQGLEAGRVGAPVQPDACAVIVAGGSGERFGDPRGKQFVPLCGMPLLAWSLRAFDEVASVGHMVLVLAQDRWDETREQLLAQLNLRCSLSFAPSGVTRQDSVFSGLRAVPSNFELVAVHDAARPLIKPATIEQTLAALRQDASCAGAIAATPCIDTLKLVEGGAISATPDRNRYWAAQTPQSFRLHELIAAHKTACENGFEGTDDASLIEQLGGRVVCVESPRDNMKVTLPEDLAMAEFMLSRRLGQASTHAKGGSSCST